jgi:hypothetical protein
MDPCARAYRGLHRGPAIKADVAGDRSRTSFGHAGRSELRGDDLASMAKSDDDNAYTLIWPRRNDD